EEVEFRLNSAIWTDPNAELADIVVEVRDVGETRSRLVRLADERLLLVCSPEVAHSFAGQDPSRALETLRHLHVQGRYDLWSRWADGVQLRTTSTATTVKLDTAVSALEAARLGLGAAVVYASYADRYLREGQLVAPLGDGVPTLLSHCIVREPAGKPPWHPAHKVLEWLSGEFAGGSGAAG